MSVSIYGNKQPFWITWSIFQVLLKAHVSDFNKMCTYICVRIWDGQKGCESKKLLFSFWNYRCPVIVNVHCLSVYYSFAKLAACFPDAWTVLQVVHRVCVVCRIRSILQQCFWQKFREVILERFAICTFIDLVTDLCCIILQVLPFLVWQNTPLLV